MESEESRTYLRKRSSDRGGETGPKAVHITVGGVSGGQCDRAKPICVSFLGRGRGSMKMLSLRQSSKVMQLWWRDRPENGPRAMKMRKLEKRHLWKDGNEQRKPAEVKGVQSKKTVRRKLIVGATAQHNAEVQVLEAVT